MGGAPPPDRRGEYRRGCPETDQPQQETGLYTGHARSKIVATVHDTDCLATGTPRCTLRARTQPPRRPRLRCGVHRGPLQPGDGLHGSHHQGTLEEPLPFITAWVRNGRCTRSSAEYTNGVSGELQRLLPEYPLCPATLPGTELEYQRDPNHR